MTGLDLSQADPLSLQSLLLHLVIGLVLAWILRWHFRRFASTLANRGDFPTTFPFIVLTTILIISVVKSSLALSLGLVGALSIVRFRTPIKEPEELAYLFLAIAMGLGLGADQTAPTVVAGSFIMVAMGLIKGFGGDRRRNLYLSLDWRDDALPTDVLDQVEGLIAKHAANADLRRCDARGGSLEATYLVDVPSRQSVSGLMADLRQAFPAMGVTFLDQSPKPGE